MRIYRSKDFVWKNNHLYGKGRAESLVSVVQDWKYTTMWRVRTSDGALSDQVNLTRAKDAAVSIVLRGLNTQETPRVAPPMRQTGVPATLVATKH